MTLVITVLAARTLNADAFGVMALAMATGWLLGVATDAGLSMHLARETARRSGQARQLLIEVLRLRAGLAYLAATMIAFFTPRIVPPNWKMQFVLIVLAQLTGAVIETSAHYFRGIGRSEIESAIHAAYRFSTLVLARDRALVVAAARFSRRGDAHSCGYRHARFNRDRMATLRDQAGITGSGTRDAGSRF